MYNIYFGYEIICYYTRIGNSAFTVSNEPNSFLMSLYPSYLLIGWDVVDEMTEIGLLVRKSQVNIKVPRYPGICDNTIIPTRIK